MIECPLCHRNIPYFRKGNPLTETGFKFECERFRVAKKKLKGALFESYRQVVREFYGNEIANDIFTHDLILKDVFKEVKKDDKSKS